jgi:hypothetical protein
MFSVLKKAVALQFDVMKGHQLYRVQVDKDQLWDVYLSSFPAGSNPLYKQRTEHDCQCCKSFIRAVGGIVAIIDGQLVSLWDVRVGNPYQPVVDALSALVKSSPIDNIFLHTERTAGTDGNLQQLESKEVLAWEHFFITLPTTCVVRGDAIGPQLSDFRSTKDVLLRGLKEITLESIDTILELISQNSLYRGEEHTFELTSFRKLKVEFAKVRSVEAQDLFAWLHAKAVPAAVSRIRGNVIGSLLTDLSEGREMDAAVASYESKVAPTNYKRPTALITKGMIEKARTTIEELGFTSALDRRYATIEDITINNILFADRKAKKAMNVFDGLASAVPEKVPNLDKIETVSIEDFLANVLPKAESLEVMFENRHAGNLLSLIAPVDPTAKTMFKWPNNFSWSYAGELADSIKERVKRAGGAVDGDLRCSLSWFNYDDLDLHLIEPGASRTTINGEEICFSNRRSRAGGELDVDMNVGSGGSRSAVENITYPDRRTMREGLYRLFVYNYNKRETVDVGFEVEIEFDGVVRTFAHPKAVPANTAAVVAEFNYTHKGGLEIVKSLPSSQAAKNLWGIPTQTFHKVSVLMLSPNYWDEKTVGNKHYFFMLDGCLNDGKARGFFNEFLTDSLNVHRKVFEVVGSKMKTEESDRQLSGIGFSSTQRNYILCRVKGSFTRTLKITF